MHSTAPVDPPQPVKNFDADDVQTRERFDKALRDLNQSLKSWTEAIHESERLSEEDFAVRINARD